MHGMPSHAMLMLVIWATMANTKVMNHNAKPALRSIQMNSNHNEGIVLFYPDKKE